MPKKDLARRPIGVFDSGLGGLTVAKQIHRVLPHEDVVYLGDLAHLPYGIKSKKQICEFSEHNIRFLIKKKVKAIIVACNSASSSAFPSLKKKFRIPMMDVIHPAVQEAVSKSKKGRIGIIGTLATIESESYEREIKKIAPSMKVFSQSCPLFVSLVEQGWLNKKVTREIAETYLKPLLKKKIDVLILGCTHYPLLKSVIQRVVGKKVKLVTSAPQTIKNLKGILQKKDILRKSGQGKFDIFVTDKGQKFTEIGSRFLGVKIKKIKEVKV